MEKHLYAGIFKRLITLLIDLVPVVVILQFLVFKSGGMIISYSKKEFLDSPDLSTITTVFDFVAFRELGIFFLILFVYFSISQMYLGGTIGQFIMKSQVIKKTGEKINLLQSILKSVFFPIDFFFVGGVSILLSPYYQSIGDRVAGTVVVNKSESHEKPYKKPVSSFRGLFAGILIICLLFASYKAYTFSSDVYEVKSNTQRYYGMLQDGLSSGNFSEIYSESAQLLKDAISLEDFTKTMLENEQSVTFFDASNTLSFSKIAFRMEKGREFATALTRTSNGIDLGFDLIPEGDSWSFASFYTYK